MILFFILVFAIHSLAAEENQEKRVFSAEDDSNFLKFFEGLLGKASLKFDECKEKYLRAGSMSDLIESFKIITERPETILNPENRQQIGRIWKGMNTVLERCGRSWFVSAFHRDAWFRGMYKVFESWISSKESSRVKPDQDKLQDIALQRSALVSLLESNNYYGMGEWMKGVLALLETDEMIESRNHADDAEWVAEKKRKRDEENRERMKRKREKEKRGDL